MIACVDTNVLVRHLTDDPTEQANRATAILENAERLILTYVVVAELVHVLGSFYERPRRKIAESVQSLLTLSSIAVSNLDLLLRALELYEHTRLDFAEAYLAAAAELTGVGTVASFDRALDRVETNRSRARHLSHRAKTRRSPSTWLCENWLPELFSPNLRTSSGRAGRSEEFE